MNSKIPIKRILCAAVAAVMFSSLAACTAPLSKTKDLTASSLEFVVANAPAVSTRKVVIKASPANIRSGPGRNYSVIGRTQKGKSFDYLGTKKDNRKNVWYKIQYTKTKTGWVISSLGKLTAVTTTKATTAASKTTSSTTSVTEGTVSTTTTSWMCVSSIHKPKTTASTTPTGTTTTTTAAARKKNLIISGNPVNVRSGAGKNYSKIGSTSRGKKYELLGTEKDSSGTKWYKIQYTASKAGWVLGSLAYIEGEKPNNKDNGKVAYLTFDDGPSVNTIKILDILDKYNVKATFFVIYHGNMKSKYQEIVKRGHTLALHSYTHDYSKIYKSEKGYYSDLNKIHDYVEKTTGVDSKIIRFPGGSSNTVSNKYNKGIMKTLKKSVTKNGYYYHDWNVSSGDAAGRNIKASKLLKNVKSGIGKKKVINVLMHDTCKSKMTTVEALPSIIEYIRSQGYSFEAITEDSTLIQHG